MSLYNMLHGTHGLDQILGFALELDIAGGKYDTGRYRDIWLSDGKICLFTRNGGGNREEYQDTIDALAEHPNYLCDYDDDFDSTYATIEFSYPEQYRDLIKHLAPKEKEPSLLEKTDAAIESLSTKVPELSQDETVAKKLDELLTAMKKDSEFEKPSKTGAAHDLANTNPEDTTAALKSAIKKKGAPMPDTIPNSSQPDDLDEILASVEPIDIEDVEIQPDGSWRVTGMHKGIKDTDTIKQAIRAYALRGVLRVKPKEISDTQIAENIEDNPEEQDSEEAYALGWNAALTDWEAGIRGVWAK